MSRYFYQRKLTENFLSIAALQYWELLMTLRESVRDKYGETLRISPYSVGMRENTDRNNSEYGHILHSLINLGMEVIYYYTFLAKVLL